MLERRPSLGSLRGRERVLEEARQDALRGGAPWNRPAAAALRRTRRRRGPRSPAIPLFGEWFEEPGVGSADEEAPDASAPEITTEAEAPAMEEIERVEIDRQEQEDAVLIHTFEKTETLDEYRGGGRDTDGSDNLSDHLDALQEVDLGKLVRDGTTTKSALRADLPWRSRSPTP